ncbi:MAG: terminase small subunit [Elusimicrobia bacterium]|jgi:phage terminase small subunit|nr:terminase small subunit [Elusimicrobiota bacterium]
MVDLPKLTTKQQQFVLHYTINGGNASDAYRSAYDCSKMSDKAINVEACKLLKNPNVTLWLNQAELNKQEVFEDELKYSVKDCFDELSDVQKRAKKDKGNYSQEIKAIELKGKLAGHFIDKHQVTGGGLADVLDKLQ